MGLSPSSFHSRLVSGALLSGIRTRVSAPAFTAPQSHSLVLARALEQGLSGQSSAETTHELVRQIQESGLNLERAYAGLAPQQQQALSRAVGGRHLEEIFSLAHERNETVFAAGLQQLAQDQMEVENFSQAGSYFQSILQGPAASDRILALQARARESLDILNGGGPAGARLAFLGRQLINQTTRTDMLVGMAVALPVFQTVRLGALGRFLNPATISSGTRLLAAETAAATLAFGAEVGAFTFSVRGVNEALGKPQDWSEAAVEGDLFRNGLGLFSLRVSGALGGAAMRRIQGANPNPSAWMRFSEIAIPQASMLTGILGANALEVGLRLRPASSFGNTLMDSLAMLLQFNIAGRITHGFYPESFHQQLQEMDIRLQTLRRPLFGKDPLFPGLSEGVTPEGFRFPHVLASMSNEGSSSSPPPPAVTSSGVASERPAPRKTTPPAPPALPELPRVEWEVPGKDRYIHLLGQFPRDRLTLSQRHFVKASLTLENIESVEGRGIPIDRKRITSLWNGEAENLGAEFLEAYDFATRDRLQSTWGSQFATNVINKLRPGGVGLAVMTDPEALRAFGNILTQEGYGEILSSFYGAPLPFPTSRADATSSNYMLFRRFQPGNGHRAVPLPRRTEALPPVNSKTVALSAEQLADPRYRDYPVPDAQATESLKSSYDDLEVAVFKLYSQYSHHQDWVRQSLEINRELIPLVVKTEETVRSFRGNAETPGEFRLIVRDLNEINRLLENLQARRSEEPGRTSPKDSYKIEEFLRNLYRCVNRFGNYLNNNADLMNIHSTVEKARSHLRDYLGQSQTP